MRRSPFAILLFLGACAGVGRAGNDGVPLFNGRDLSGWINVNGAPETWSVRDGVVHSTGRPICILRTERMYENFILEMEWLHEREGGNAGLFLHSSGLPVRGQPFSKGIEVQIIQSDHPDGIATRHGDVFAIQGATFVPDRPHPRGWMRCLPSERRVKPAGEWNHYRVESRDGTVKLHVNGKEVAGGTKCNPRKGYLCLESEGSPARFRNLRILELPGSEPPPGEVAAAETGYVSLFNGLDTRGWKADPANEGHWKGREDWILDSDGRGATLWTEREYKDFVLVADWRFPKQPVERRLPVFDASGRETGTQPTMDAGDSGIFLRGHEKAQVNLWSWPCGSGEIYGYRTDASQPPEVRAAAVPLVKADEPPGKWNRIVLTLRGERLSVELNGKRVIDGALLPGLPARGPIGLQSGGEPVQFANLHIRELE
jgi:hypothetical protein